MLDMRGGPEPQPTAPKPEDLPWIRAQFWRWFRRERRSYLVPLFATLAGALLTGLSAWKDLPKGLEHLRPYSLAVLLLVQSILIAILLLSVLVGPRPARMQEDPADSLQRARRANRAADRFVLYWSWVWGGWLALYTVWGIQEFTDVERRLNEDPQDFIVSATMHSRVLTSDVPGNPPPLRTELNLSAETLKSKALLNADSSGWTHYLDTTADRARTAIRRTGATFYADTSRSGRPRELEDAGTVLWEPTYQRPLPAEVWSVLRNLLNNLSTLAFAMCGYILARLPTPLHKLRRPTPIVIGVTLLSVLAICQFLAVLNHSSSEQLDWFGWSSGVAAGATMAFFVGRLQSRFFGPPTWLVMSLYVYAVIQTAWPVFMRDVNVTLMLVSLALLLKILLFYLVYWTFRSGTLLYYFMKVRETESFEGARRSSEIDRENFIKTLLPPWETEGERRP